MSSFKLSPLSIFLIMLIVLVISVVFSKSHWSIPEGFIAYNYAGESPLSSLQQMIILPYSKTVKVYHVYDSIYFDVNNGSVIEFFGKQYDASKPNSENVLTDMFVLPRSGTNVKNYSLTNDVKTIDEAVCPNDTTSNMSNNSWVFPENANTNINSFQYQILYIPWGKDTVLFIYDVTISKKIVSFTLFSNNIPSTISMNQDIFRISNLHYKTDSDSRNNSYIVEPLYDPAKSSTQFSDVFQISSNVLFDVKNGYLMIRTNGKIDIYNGSGVSLFSQVDTPGKVKDTPVTVSNLKSFVLNDVDGQNIVVYIPMGSNIMVAVLTADPNNSNLFMIRNVVRFNSSVPSGIDGKPNIEHKSSPSTPSTTASSTTSTSKTESKMDFSNLSLNDVISKYYQQYYGSTNGGGGNVPGAYSNDFLLKTQIIPPVCPSCPSCPNNVSCTNCGGNGGAGVVGAVQQVTTYYDVFGNKIVYDASKNPILVDKNGNQIIQIFDNSGNQVQFVHGHFIPIPPTSSDRIVSSSAPTTSPNTNFGGAVSSLGSSASNLGGNVVNTAGSIVGGTIGAAAGLAGTTIGTAGSIVNNAISTVGKFGQGTTGMGTTGMGGMETGTSHDSKIYQNSRGMAGNYNGDSGQSSVAPKGNYITSGADPSTYYGAIPDRGTANFIPVTSDFSKFGR